MTAFTDRFGFERGQASLANWRELPFSRWSFQNVGEIVPSAAIRCADGLETETDSGSRDLISQTVSLNGRSETIGAFLERTHTDAFLVMKAGKIIAEHNAPHMDADARHIIFSISKSLTAIIAGVLEGSGLLDPDAPVTRYFPEAGGSAYADATVRHVLDMTVSLDFEETYLDPASAFGRYRRATLWNPGLAGAPAEAMRGFIAGIGKGDGPHGEVFAYRSPNSDLLGIIVELASGARYADLMSETLWMPLQARRDAFVTVDAEGTARAAGGISVTAHDLARVGEMMRQGGAVGSRQVVPESWVHDTVNGGDAAAWGKGDFSPLLANGRYRSKWYQTGYASRAFCGIGIHGQWLYVDPATETVIVKLSSQPLPVDDPMDKECLDFFQAVARMV